MSFLHGRLRGLRSLNALVAVTAALLLYAAFSSLHPSVSHTISGWNYLVTYPVLLVAGLAFSFARSSWSADSRLRLGPRPGEDWPLRAANRHTAHAAFFVLAGAVLTKHGEVSRLFLGTFFPALWMVLLLGHLAVHRWIARILFSGHRTLDTLVVADVTDQDPLLGWLRDHNHLGLKLSGVYSRWLPPGFEELDARRFGATPEEAIARMSPRLVICSDRNLSGERLGHLRLAAENVGCRFAVHLDRVSGLGGFGGVYTDQGQAIAVYRKEPLESPAHRVLKRAFDLAFALPVVVFVLPPLMALVWTCHRFQSPGPLFFVQPRTGAGGRVFPCYKFRTMHSGHGREGEQAKTGDDRIFPAGRWLRKTSLDEFPQFLNVLRGEMSVVGPRPHFVEHDAHFESIDPLYRLRKLVKPGVTGLAQVSGYRGETKTRADVRGRSYTDLEYLENWSLRLDLVIVFKTIGAMFRPPRTAR